MNKVKIGILGAGDHAQRSHIDHLQRIDNAQVVAVCDLDQEQLKNFSNLKTYTSFEAMLQSDIDAVIICTPDRFHADSMALAIEHNKHVLVEKPVADTKQGLVQVAGSLALAKQKGLVVTSCHPRRFDPPFTLFKDRLDEFITRFGKPVSFSFDFFYHKPSKMGLHTGLLMDHINHEIDLLNFFYGLSSFKATKLYDTELGYAACGVREDGLNFYFAGTRSLNVRTYHELFRARFEKAEIEVHTGLGKARISYFESNSVQDIVWPNTDYDRRFYLTNKNFIDAINGVADNYLTDADLFLNTDIGIELTHNGVYDFKA